MTMTDPIADMLTRIRNANTVGHSTVEIPASKMKKSIAGILADEGYIKGFDVIEDSKQGILRIQMKYGADKERVISGIKKISKPGLRFMPRATRCQRYWEDSGSRSSPLQMESSATGKPENLVLAAKLFAMFGREEIENVKNR